MQYLKDGVKTFSLLILSTLIAYFYFNISSNVTNIAIFYMLYVFLVARWTSGYIWCVIASIGGMLGVNYLFTYPYFAFNFTLSGYPITFISMLTVAIITSTLTAHTKEQARVKALHEVCLNRLNEFNKQLLVAESHTQIIELTLNYVSSAANGSCVFYLSDPMSAIHPIYNLIHPEDQSIFASTNEQAAAHLAYVSEKPSGMGSTTQDSKCTYLPVLSHHHIWGVLGFLASDQSLFMSENLSLLKLMLPQMALAFERQTLIDEHQTLAIESEKEKMRANLLRAVSHDLRTPLTGMIGASATYIDNHTALNEAEKLRLVSQIHEDSNWLLHMVENLLSVTRIVQDTAKVVKSQEVLEEVISEALSKIKKRYPHAKIHISVPDEIILVPMDATLIEQVMINLVENAIKHARATQPIDVIAYKENAMLRIDVVDDGIGISPERLETLFDGYCPNSDTTRDVSKGMGIGLSICKTIISAHSGQITAKNLEKGTVFTFTLPLEDDA